MRSNGQPPGGNNRLGVLLAIFDFPMLNVGYRTAIDGELDMHVVGEIESRDALFAQLERTPADVVIAECIPFGQDGCSSFQTIESIKAAMPALKVLALDCRCGHEQFSLALKAGADGFLTRNEQPADVVNALRCVSRGQTYVSPSIVTKMVNTYVLRSPHGQVEDVYDTLSERDREVLLLAAVGHTNREIAKTLHLSEQTVHNYRANIMEKLGFHDRVELLKFAIRRGVIEVSDL